MEILLMILLILMNFVLLTLIFTSTESHKRRETGQEGVSEMRQFFSKWSITAYCLIAIFNGIAVLYLI